jgi:hypothetical protein
LIRQFQAVLRIDTRNPPGNEHLAADNSSRCSTRKGSRRRFSRSIRTASNVVARLKGNGRKRLLIMGHSARRDRGRISGSSPFVQRDTRRRPGTRAAR